MKPLVNSFYSLSGWKLSLILFSALVLYTCFVMWTFSGFILEQAPAGYKLPDGTFGYDGDYIRNFFGGMDEWHISQYAIFLIVWDSFYPLFYGATFMFVMAWALKPVFGENSNWRMLALFCFIPAFVDFIENALEREIISLYLTKHTVHDGFVSVASGFTQVKWILCAVMILLVIVSLFLRIAHEMKHRSVTN